MVEITASLVKELRERTSVGMMECKKALVAANGDLERAIEDLRKAGQAKAVKKGDRIAAEGLAVINVASDAKSAALVEINCETDFVAKEDKFKHFANCVAKVALNAAINDVTALASMVIPETKKTIEDTRLELITQLGENIAIRRCVYLNAKDGVIGTYLHGSAEGARIAAMVVINKVELELAKDLAMQVAAMKPECIAEQDIPQDRLAKEKEIFVAEVSQNSVGKPADIIEEVKGLKADGYQEITLLGQNVNSYGKDLEEDYDFATLLEEVAKTGIARIRFTTSHPWDFSREMIEIINQYDNIMPYIHLPVQSGNTEILKLMGRRYTREQYLELFRMIKEVMPDCSITTDIIVGFPNETEEQFQDTLSLYEECEYDLAYTFIYSPREGTPAAKMQDNVPFEQKQDRLERLNEVVKEKALKQNQRFLNQVVDVLVDGPSKRDETMMTGYTAHQKLINFKGRKEDIGKIVPVKVTEVKTWALKGEQVD